MVQILKSDTDAFRQAAKTIDAIQAGKLWAATRQDDFDQLSKADALRLLCRSHDSLFDVPDSRRFDVNVADELLCRTAVGNATIVETFSTNIGNAMLAAIEDEPSSTDGWVYEGSMPNFLVATWFTQEYAARLERLTKDRPAETTSFGTKGEPVQVCRYASQFVMSDQDWVNGQTVGAVKLAASEQAVAAARLKDDLVYSMILSNPTLTADNLALFHSSHNNKATGGGSVLAATSLDTAIAAMGRQYLKAETDSYPTHANLRARYLIVPPELVGLALRTVRDMDTDGPTLKVRMESRLTDLGTVDAHSGTLYKGTATNWLLSAKASARPSICVAGLDGPPTPQIRSFTLGVGQWGMGWDIKIDLAAIAADYRGVYFSLGA